MENPLEVVEGTQVQLMCGAIGKPLPKLSWFKDGKLIYSSGRVEGSLVNEVVVQGKGMVLKFRQIRSKHEGTYKCLATNEAGNQTREAKLVVNSHVRWDTPMPPQQHINV